MSPAQALSPKVARALALAAGLFQAGQARAGDGILSELPDWLSAHGQFTLVAQGYPSFHASFDGPNSLTGRHQLKETTDATLFLGARLLDGLEVYVNPEIDQGFGLSNTLGMAGFPSGEAFKIGQSNPYFRLPRAFVRYTVNLGGEDIKVDDGPNQVADQHTADTVTITIGKFSSVDIFDTNAYAHDPRADFLNWSVIESGAYDYAADAWGYSYGGAVEWSQDWWTLRAGLFDLSVTPNSVDLEQGFDQFEVVAEAEARFELFGGPGKVKLLGFANRGRMGSYNDALALARATGGAPDTGAVRRYRTRPGAALNLEQAVSDSVGAFVRLSFNDGSKEAFDFTEINRSVAAGVAVRGALWGRGDDTVGVAVVGNGLSSAARAYFAAGGLGILIGDGQLPRYGWEKIGEIYYKAAVVKGVALTFDYQHAINPAYDAARGPIDILGVRLHAEF